MNDGPNAAEKKALDQLKKVCEKKGWKSQSTLQNCGLLHKQLELEKKQKQIELETIARMNLMTEKLMAFMYVTSRMNALQNEVTLLLAALQKASAEYDLILSSRAAQPLLGEIFQLLVLAALPELKVVGRAFTSISRRVEIRNWKALQAAASKSKADSWDTLVDEVMTVGQKSQKLTGPGAKKFVDSLDNASKDLIEAIKNPIAANAAIDAETQSRLAAYNAKNSVLGPIIKEVTRSLVAATMFEPILHLFIFWYEAPDIATVIKNKFGIIGYDGDLAYNADAFDLFADLVLYDMLRAYVKGYVKIDGFDGDPLEKLPQRNDNVFGIDGAQRKMVYNKFGKVRWKDTTRPPVNDYKDLIRHWNATFNKDFKRFKLSLGGG
jgi:hypothetical protein